ncbi:hypothetical protein QZH41_009916 [Actinostola sp. cb2023]|nr:hypothetical protein QZH41_009916 [Actinostola sp. cb2023]
MLDYFHRVTLDVIGKVAFDMDLNSVADDHTSFPSAVSNSFKGMMFKFRNPFYKNLILGEILWGDPVGRSCGEILWGDPVGRSCGEILWGDPVGRSCGEILWDDPVGRSCGEILWGDPVGRGEILWGDPPVGRSCGEILWGDPVGRSCGEILWGDPVGRSCGEILWGDPVGRSCGEILWGDPVGRSCGEILWGDPVGRSCGEILWGDLVGRSCGEILWGDPVGRSCGEILWGDLVGRSCGEILWGDPFNPWTYDFQRKVADSVKLLRETGRQCIEKRRQAIPSGQTVPEDILSTMMKLLDVDSLDITDEELLDDFVTFFVAVYSVVQCSVVSSVVQCRQETTANQLSFMLLEVTQRPEIMDKPDYMYRLLAEIHEVLGSGDYVEFDDLAKLEYMGQVLKETLRLYPPAHAVARATTKDDDVVLNGHVIPPNTNFMVSIYSSHRWPGHFEDPEKFDPDRWSPENADKIPHFAYLPFSAGPRNCIGQVFAQFESKVVMARFLKKFHVTLCPGQTRTIKQQVTLQPRDGVMCTLVTR